MTFTLEQELFVLAKNYGELAEALQWSFKAGSTLYDRRVAYTKLFELFLKEVRAKERGHDKTRSTP